jgi:hypothetical protein
MHTTIGHPDRLERLAALLERDAANPEGVQFDLGFWIAPADRPRRGFETRPDKVEVSCNTQACAMGLAAISGEFKAEGLDYKVDPYAHWLIPTITPPGEREYAGFEAASVLLGIPYEAAQYLFDPDFYDSDEPTTAAEGERHVAQRIRDFIATGNYYGEPDAEDDNDY